MELAEAIIFNGHFRVVQYQEERLSREIKSFLRMTGIRWKKTMVFQKGTEEDDTNFTVEIKGGTYQGTTF